MEHKAINMSICIRIFVAQRLPEPTVRSPKKVLLYTYMRSGSSFLGEIFNRNPDVFYIFEPYQGFYNAFYGNPFGWKPLDVLFYGNGSMR